MSNPLYGMDPNAMLAITEDFLHHFGEGADVKALLPKLPQQGGTHPPMDQSTENRIMAQGTPVSVLPSDNHVAHIDVLEKYSNSPAFDSLPEHAVALMGVHMQQHNQMLQQHSMATGGPMAGGGGQGNNVPTGMSAGGGQTDLNALEGGIV